MNGTNYSSGDDIVVEFLRLRFSFNAADFAQRVCAAAFRLGLVDENELDADETDDLVELTADGVIEEPRSELGRYLVRHWERLSLVEGESLVYWLRKLVFRGAWLDHRVKDGRLDVTWDDGPNGQVSSELIWSRLRDASLREGAVAREVGDVARTLGSSAGPAGGVLEATFEMPLLAHACMEPLNCTVHVTPNSAEAWIGTQVMERVHAAVAKAAELPESQVTVHNHLIGGGFGRRLEPDMAYTAARIARHVDGPVKVVWTREEDIRHDIYRPAYHDRLWARLEGDRIVGWKHRVSGSAVMARFLPPVFRKGVDPDGVDSAQDIPYDIPNLRVEFNREEPPGINTGFWRGVGPNNNVFAIESFIDELARKAGKDPIDFRRTHLNKTPRLRAALDLVREKSGWGSALPARCGRGVSVQTSFASFIATVVECEVGKTGEVKLRRVTTAVDAGIAVNPDTIVAQLQGGHVFGLTAALYGEITLEKGRVQQSNFHDYRMLRIDQIPAMDIQVIRSDAPPGGIGEAGTTAALPALRNAIYAATGVALRRMPIDRKLLAGTERT
jgi:isoquinoline 1-oxidoreductase beta subunit